MEEWVKDMSNPLWTVSKIYIAGESVEDALRVSKAWNQFGASVIINYLGEHIRENTKVLTTVTEYLKLIPMMRNEGIRGSVDIKPSQLGLRQGHENFSQNLHKILEVTQDADIFVWIDMEQYRSVKPTLMIYRSVLDKFGSKQVGICLQANLKRTPNDLDELVKDEARIRLVKGAYLGNPVDILPRGPPVDNAYRILMRKLFETSPRFVLGTHDPLLIEESIILNETWNRDVEWEMLMGVTVDNQMDLLMREIPLGVYIPYGQSWDPYVRRRLLEARRNQSETIE